MPAFPDACIGITVALALAAAAAVGAGWWLLTRRQRQREGKPPTSPASGKDSTSLQPPIHDVLNSSMGGTNGEAASCPPPIPSLGCFWRGDACCKLLAVRMPSWLRYHVVLCGRRRLMRLPRCALVVLRSGSGSAGGRRCAGSPGLANRLCSRTPARPAARRAAGAPNADAQVRLGA
jgi:hypothetical protein